MELRCFLQSITERLETILERACCRGEALRDVEDLAPFYASYRLWKANFSTHQRCVEPINFCLSRPYFGFYVPIRPLCRAGVALTCALCFPVSDEPLNQLGCARVHA